MNEQIVCPQPNKQIAFFKNKAAVLAQHVEKRFAGLAVMANFFGRWDAAKELEKIARVGKLAVSYSRSNHVRNC
ncbi:MAG: hypothetical protein DSY87_00250 [Methylococcus sp.]|nr:MAG: hypothetical protein DSY87_00250 [Methylococcus sp.]